MNIEPTALETTRRSGFVLIVDDEEQNRTLLKDPLEAKGYEVAEAEDGLRALQLVARRHPDVILLDVMMPKMHGFDVCRHLKDYHPTAAIPILMVTALSERQERLKGIQAGANDFLNKPVDIQDVILRVGNAVHAKHLFDQLRAERERSESLLLNILPKAIAERMKKGETTIADSYPEATVLFADLVNFTSLAAHISPDQVVYLLNEIFSAFDLLTEQRGLEKIKTVRDGYLVAGGLPVERPDHAEAVADLALDMQKQIQQFNQQNGTSIRIRIGICTGPVVAGVIGRKKFAYDLWGDTVNVAFRLESAGEGGSIQVSQSTYDKLKHRFQFEVRQCPVVKGPGEFTAYGLCGRV